MHLLEFFLMFRVVDFLHALDTILTNQLWQTFDIKICQLQKVEKLETFCLLIKEALFCFKFFFRGFHDVKRPVKWFRQMSGWMCVRVLKLRKIQTSGSQELLGRSY